MKQVCENSEETLNQGSQMLLKSAKNHKKIVVVGILCAFIAVVILLILIIMPKLKFRKAMSLLASGDYDSGYSLLEKLGKTEIIALNKNDRAMTFMNSGDYESAYALLEEIGDSDTIASSKHDRAMKLIESEDYDSAYALLEELSDNEAIESSKYDRAMKLIESGDYDSAYALLEELSDNEAIKSSKYDRAMTLIESGEYDSAYGLLEEIGESEIVASNKYDRAIKYMDSGDYEQAYNLLEGLNYKDSDEKLQDIDNLQNSIAEEAKSAAAVSEPEEEGLNDIQKNSIAMLNYLAVLSQEINSSKNSRIFLEEAYNSLINNTNPENVNELTESHMSSLLDFIEKYRMVAVKRDRLQYIYEQDKAMALQNTVPDPADLLNADSCCDWKELAAYAINLAVDKYSSYSSNSSELDYQYMKDGWELDDEESANLYDIRKRAFTFMVQIVREYQLPGELALNETAVEAFVNCQNNTNTYEKIQFLESEQSTYEAFGLYWLELADCYYEIGEYEACLESVAIYEDLQADIFRKDYYLAQTLPNVIVAAGEVYDEETYISEAERYLELLLSNTERNEWSLRYFAAQVYLDLYAKTNQSNFLDKAYDIALNNVTYLITEQREQNETYLTDVVEISVPESSGEEQTKDEKDEAKQEEKQIKEYNNALHEQRNTELPPVYEPLALNLDLLFALAEERNITASEKTRINGILRGNGNVVFLSTELEAKYSFSNKQSSVTAAFDKTTLTLPANCLSVNSKVIVKVIDSGKTTTYDDWSVKEVVRPSENIEDFTVIFTSETIKNQEWSKNAKVKVEVTDETGSTPTSFTLEFKPNYTARWWIVPDSIEFEQVK